MMYLLAAISSTLFLQIGAFHLDLKTATNTPLCTYSANPLGTCGCEEQLFINENCTTGFWCSDQIPDPFLYDGCMLKCNPDKIIVVDIPNHAWSCETRTEDVRCPGKFNINCPDDDVGGNFDGSVCECDGQLWVNHDCTDNFFCLSRYVEGGRSIKCTNGTVLEVDFAKYSAVCRDDIGQCPGLGGFTMGCAPGAPDPPLPELNCTFASNPLGDCGCEQQIFVNEDCTESFYCASNSPEGTDGCDLKCEQGEIVMMDFINKEWHCEQKPEDFICPGKFEVDCPNDNNEFEVTCGCENEVWMNSDCTEAFLCDGPAGSDGSNQGHAAKCGAGKIIDIDFYHPFRYGCIDASTGKCPGSFHFGCQGGDIPDLTPICTYGTNPLGECKCNEQLFINEDCTEGFWCSDTVPDPNMNDGCSRKCHEGQILVPDIPNHSWDCVDAASSGITCPGRFNLRCPEDDVGTNFDFTNCECNGQLWMSADCREAFFCYSRLSNGGRHQTCPEGQIVEIDLSSFSWECTENVEKCPSGMGGFTMGCTTGAPTLPPPQIDCDFVANPLGNCGCNDQVFINEDCSQGFYCSDQAPEGKDGCLLDCPEGTVVYMTPSNFSWECREDIPSFICPGAFEVDCPSDTNEFSVNCKCNGEVWMNQECNQAFYCSGAKETNGENPGYLASCEGGKVIDIDFYNPFVYGCSEDTRKCPGSFHFGCRGGEIPHASATTASAAVSLLILSLTLLSVFP